MSFTSCYQMRITDYKENPHDISKYTRSVQHFEPTPTAPASLILNARILRELDSTYVFIDYPPPEPIDPEEYKDNIVFLYNKGPTTEETEVDPRFIYLSKDVFTQIALGRLQSYFDNGARAIAVDASIWGKNYPTVQSFAFFLRKCQQRDLRVYFLFLKTIRPDLRSLMEQYINNIELIHNPL